MEEPVEYGHPCDKYTEALSPGNVIRCCLTKGHEGNHKTRFFSGEWPDEESVSGPGYS